ncbi:MAG: polysaccharide deacetylase family protein [bacterium]
MPLTKKIKIIFYILCGIILSLLSSIAIFLLSQDPLLSLIFGFLPFVIIGVLLTYVFYPKFDPCSSIRFDKTKKLVALTFDDGPTNGFTEEVLSILEQKKVVATFFVIGSKASNNTELTLNIIKKGHELGAHTYTHKKLHLSDIKIFDEEISKSIDFIRSAYKTLDKEKDYKKIFRSPHGFKNIRLKRYLIKNKIALIPWTRGVWDTDAPGAEWIVTKATEKPRNNEIILFHDGKGLDNKILKTQSLGLLQALPKVIDFYKNKGYTFIKVSDLIR